jgi:hypothetical protein
MRTTAVLLTIATLVAAFAGANAQTQIGFRLLKLDGRNVVWTGKPRSTTVTYAFVKTRTDTADAINCGSLGPLDPLLTKSQVSEADFRAETKVAFGMWEAAANIAFTEISDAARADILIGAQLQPRGRAFTNVAYKPQASDVSGIERSLICLNPEMKWKVGFDGNLNAYDIRYTMAHEIGHAIGLDHPAGSDQLMHFRYEERFRTLQRGDVEGAVLLYGPRQTPATTPVSTSAMDPLLAKAERAAGQAP